jgi:hypothetical protein
MTLLCSVYCMVAEKPPESTAGKDRLSLRVPTALRMRLERYASSVQSERPGLFITVSGVARSLLEQALASVESQDGKSVTARRPRKTIEGEARDDVQLALRLPSALLVRVDEYVERVKKEEPGLGATRSGGVRALLDQALTFVESVQGEQSW